ncbi:MAG: hypothetical protein ABF651_08660 [Sporolactobacillus sp.]
MSESILLRAAIPPFQQHTYHGFSEFEIAKRNVLAYPVTVCCRSTGECRQS